MTEDTRAALLIDADNLSPEGMERGLAELKQRGLRVSGRRAYGSHETLVAIRDFLQAHSVRAIVNQGKGTTDAALIVDAMDLLLGQHLPAVVAIGSGDGDFAPLVVRLRESGRRVVCLAQRKKSAEGLDRVYDEVIYIDEAPRRAASSRAATPAAPAAPAVSRAARKSAKAVPEAPARKAAKKAAPRRQAAAEESLAQRVRRVLEEFPGFRQGEEIEMNAVAKRLKDENLMAKNTSSRRFLATHAPDVELGNHTVRLVR